MNARQWYHRCMMMATGGLGLSLGNLWSTSGPSFGPQMAAAVLIIGAAALAYMTKTAP